MIEFEYDEERARHATLWLLQEHGTLDHIKLLKLVVLADVEHLKRYGRPIVGGEYFAMEHGPVASQLYDELKLRSIPGTAAVNDFTLRGVES
ncbi:MAG: Panacea domain-containing protein, partial [Polyangiaceae bacterium]